MSLPSSYTTGQTGHLQDHALIAAAMATNTAAIAAITSGSYLQLVAAPTGVAATDTAAIQAAINVGGHVWLQPGQYELTLTGLVMQSNVILQGAGENRTTLHQASSAGTAITGVDLSHVAIRDLRVLGPGPWTGTGYGVDFTLSGTGGNATFYVEMRNVRAEEFGLDGVRVNAPIVSEFSRVQAFKNGRHGIHLYATGDIAGTSCTLTACFGAGNYGAGIRLKQMAYSTLNSCAGDANGMAYEYDTCNGITENACGSEEPYDFSAHQAGYVGYSRKIFNCKATLNSPYMIGNIGVALWVTNASIVTINSLFEGSPGNTDSPTNNPTDSLKVDSGCSVVLNGKSVVTAMNLATGTTRQPGAAPTGVITPPAVPATTVVYTSTQTQQAMVTITAGSSTCTVAIGGTTVGVIPISGVLAVMVPVGQTIKLTYTNAPTWTWSLG